MSRSVKSVVVMILVIVCMLVLSKSENTLAQTTSFSDDFNRPDGLVGNEWRSWWANSLDHPNSMIFNNELRTSGYPQLGGGIYRNFPVTFPVQFSFDFRTESQKNVECASSTYNDGGWRITLNAAESTTPMESLAQVKFEQWAGSRHTVRRYITNGSATNQAGMAEDAVSAVLGQRDFTTSPSHIEGVIYEDLSARFIIHYNDGQSPDPVMINFGPAVGALDIRPGSLLMISNSNCSSGPNYIDNFKIGPVEPQSFIISGGYYHTCMVTPTGGVKCWGGNQYGQLGDGTTDDHLTAVDVACLGDKAVSVSATFYQACALTEHGDVQCWGLNNYGQLGDGTNVNRSTPVEVQGLPDDITAVTVGNVHSCALTGNGQVWCWGYNQAGQLGDGTRQDSLSPVQVTGLNPVVGLATGDAHNCAWTADGAAYCWGSNYYGNLGDGTREDQLTPFRVNSLTEPVLAMTAGNGFTCALNASHGVQCWGDNVLGQLGNGSIASSLTPVNVQGLSNGVKSIVAGGGFTCALLETGGLKCWGFNDWGGIGNGSTGNVLVPVDVIGMNTGVGVVGVGEGHTCARTTSGVTKCWGFNAQGGVGDGTTINRLTPVAVVGLDGSSQAACSNSNEAPVVLSDLSNLQIDEGTSAINSGTIADPDQDPVTLSASIGTVTNNGDGTWSWSYLATDGPIQSQSVIISADDGRGGTSATSFSMLVNNVAPVVQAINAPIAPVPVNSAIEANAAFTDPGLVDTHAAVWEWGDGSTSIGPIAETNGSGSVTGTHTYHASGVYTVKVTVTDQDGGAGTSTYQYIVVYDPNGGFVTGNGWIISPVGAYIAEPALTGRATFGFVSKYHKGASVPTGNTEFLFRVANLNFKSTSYDWMVIAGTKAQYKGKGTVNWQGEFKFMITVIDGLPDKFRIRIWNEETGEMIYDNLPGATDTANPETAIGGGAIVIHKDK